VPDAADAAALLTILRRGYRSPCGAPRCPRTATVIVRKAESSGRFLLQIELCGAHGALIVARERARELAIIDWPTEGARTVNPPRQGG
jgi:hypothetical protein